MQRSVLLQVLDAQWREHLLHMDHLRGGINLRAYGQKDPLNEYKREAFLLFESMLAEVREQVTTMLAHVSFTMDQPLPEVAAPLLNMRETRVDPALAMVNANDDGNAAPPKTVVNQFNAQDSATWGQTPRNAPCPCGSGKKYKQCHGAV
jgi:preprotein translocase subunit SecA